MSGAPVSKLRCAIYTRKSSEEGLEQDFNSLHAQRAACEAYIKSQSGEGWRLHPTAYDDGGFSGGNTERPGLRRLLADIDRGLVDVRDDTGPVRRVEHRYHRRQALPNEPLQRAAVRHMGNHPD